ncbi:MAG: hypothetical protein WCX12_00510 [Candidatus Paceibacterota bacterium]|jgi:hypothetical protein
MINPEQLELGLFIWWQASRDGSRTWGCLGRIEVIYPGENLFKVRLFDDFSLVEFKIEKLQAEDEVFLEEMKVVDPAETKQLLKKRLEDMSSEFSAVTGKAEHLGAAMGMIQMILEEASV